MGLTQLFLWSAINMSMFTVDRWDEIRRSQLKKVKRESTQLLSFDDLWRWQFELSAEDTVPEPACYTESVLEIGKVVLQMVFLELFIVER